MKIRKQWAEREDDATSLSFFQALREDGKFSGLSAPPKPEGLTRKAYSLFPRVCSGLYKDFPHLGHAYLKECVFPIYSPRERDFLMHAFSEIYAAVLELQRDKIENNN